MKLTEIILQGTAPVQTGALWAKPSDDGIVELKVFNNGAWQDTVVTPDLSPYMKTSDFNEEIVKYLLKTEASTLYQTKTDNTLSTTDKTIVGAINEILPKATGVGKVDPNSKGTGEIFNIYEGRYANVASGSYSHAEGYSTKASGSRSHAEGSSTIASSNYSHAEGYSTIASGQASHAEGSSTIASGSRSHAEGYSTIASGNYSHAEGYITIASGQASHAEGLQTKTLDHYSHAEGSNTTAGSRYSHAEGYNTLTQNYFEHAEGALNVSNTGSNNSLKTRHSVGIGDLNAENEGKNAHEIMANGDHYVFGVGGYDGTNATSEDSKTLQEVINSKQETITAGIGLEFEGNTLNVTLDTTVFKVVSVLPDSPAPGDENKIHLVPAESTGANNAYTEYVWVNSAWEILGEYTSEVDLTPYLKTVDAQATYATKTELTAHTGNTSNPHNVTKSQVGLSDVDNTSDLDKPVSTATQDALDLKQNITDNALPTTAKTITGAIAEIYNKQTTYTTVPTLTADYNIPANATTVEKVYDITVGETLFNITYDTSIKWVNDVAPITRVNHRYVVSVINNLGVWGEF